MNKIFLSGRLTADPEMRKTPGGVDVCNFTLAVDRPGTKKENKLTDFLHCTAWGGAYRTSAIYDLSPEDLLWLDRVARPTSP